KLNKSTSQGVAFCTSCEAYYRCAADDYYTPIDIYHEWVDNINEKK
ncbi:hypothetical protein ENBRE01_3483, partial [Enteropsectra breve]